MENRDDPKSVSSYAQYLNDLCSLYEQPDDLETTIKRRRFSVSPSEHFENFDRLCPPGSVTKTTVGARDAYKFTSFNDRYTGGLVPKLIRQVFCDFELGKSVTESGYNMAERDGSDEVGAFEELLQFRYAQHYIRSPEFTDGVTFTRTDNDAIIYAVYSMLLSWSRPKILRFVKFSKIKISRFVHDVLKSDADGLLHSYRGRPVCLHTFRLLKNHVKYDMDETETMLPSPSPQIRDFDIRKYVPKRLELFFQKIMTIVQKESWDDASLTAMINVNHDYGIPFGNFVTRSTGPDCPKYITGVACTGKTSILRELSAARWIIRCRGKLGTFGGKSRSPAYVAALHGALDYSYRHCAGRMIGDRGPIDNPLWTVIMQLCDPKYKHCMVRELLTFFGNTFNELVVRYHAEFKVAVFLDPYPSRNQRRMLARDESGDALRGRIAQYVEAQFMAYYMYATLFGCKIIQTPYTDDGRLDSDGQSKHVTDLCEYFGKPDTAGAGVDVLNDISKLPNDVPDILTDTHYSKCLGIFK